MGVDVRIFVQTTNLAFPKADISSLDIFGVYNDTFMKYDVGTEFDAPPNANWKLNCGNRYFGPDCTRGSWPEIRSSLVSLKGAPNVKAVWYSSDHDFTEDAQLVTDRLIAKIDECWKAERD